MLKMAAVQDIVIYRAEDILLNFTMTPVENITGWTMELNVRANPTSLILFTIAAIVTSPTTGEFTITIPSATTNIAPKSYIYDVVRTDLGAKKVLAIGKFMIRSGVRTV